MTPKAPQLWALKIDCREFANNIGMRVIFPVGDLSSKVQISGQVTL